MREMKNSGVAWIGEIPEKYSVVAVKNMFEIGRGRVIAKTELCDDGYPVYSSQTKNDGCLGYISTYDFDRDQLTWTTDGANAGTIFLRRGRHNCTNVCGTLLPKSNDICLEYQRYALWYIALHHKRADTNGFKIMNNEMAAIKTVVPPTNEQKKIAFLLDDKCSKVHTLIANQEAQIEKLKQYKKSLITEVVTKGLNPDVEMKDSGVEWIGIVNSRFNVQPINALFSIEKRILGKEPEQVLSITQRGIVPKDITSNEGQIANSYAHYQIVNKGDFAMNQMDLLTGGVGISEFEGVTSPDYRVFVMKNKEMNARYFLYVFETYYRNKIFYAFGQGAANVGRWRLPAQNFKTIYIPVPSVSEQNKIVIYLDDQCSKIDKLIEIKQSKIAKLNEYKKSLIFEYVTGKKEVC